MKSARLLPWLIAALLGSGCGDFPFETASGGSGTETTGGSKVVGRVIYPDGSAADGAVVTLRRSDYLQDTSEGKDTAFRAQAVTNGDGAFALEVASPGGYVIEIRDRKGNASMREIHRPAGGKSPDLAAFTLQRTGALRGSLGRIAGAPDRGWIQVYGLSRALRADAEGNFLLQDMPTGQVRLRALSSRPHWGCPDSLQAVIASAETLEIAGFAPRLDPDEDYRDWPHSRLVLLNLAGLELSGDLMDFPLLLRLDTGNFDFRQGGPSNLRFSDAQGTHLSFAVDQWDSAAGKAAVWVRLDRVRSGSGGLAFTMHWGRQDAPNRSEPAAVFQSFSGVWHLAEPVDSEGSGRFQDASPTGAPGTGNVVPGQSEGVIGNGRAFRGAEAIRVPGSGSLRPAQAVSLSAWIQNDGTDLFGAEIASMGDNYALRVDSDGELWFFISTDSTLAEGKWRILGTDGMDMRDSRWHHVAGTYDGTTMRVFVDGLERSSWRLGERLAYGAGRDFWLGRHGNGSEDCDYSGSLDEVQASPAARSPDWIRLSHATQKPGAALVEFK